MAYAFFKIRVNDDGSEAAELNGFLASHRVLDVDRQWESDGEKSFWSFCVDFQELHTARRTGSRKMSTRVDYKEILPADQFAMFAKLRDLRKTIAESEGLPLFALFTNEQLAEMVKTGCRTVAGLKKIDGIGEAKAGKYGERFLEELKASSTEEKENSGDS